MYKKAINLIKKHKRFLLSTHVSPDPDALSSELALADYLRSKGKTVTIVNEDKVPERLSFLPGSACIRTLRNTKRVNYDVAIIEDCGDLKRIGKVQKLIDPDKPVINIDHHITNDGFGQVNIIQTKASSTAEILYHLLKAAGCRFNQRIAHLLYAGIMTDTGSFRFENTTSVTHKIVGELLAHGVNPTKIYRQLYESVPLNDIKQFTRVMNQFESFNNQRVICVQLTKKKTAGFSKQFDLRDALFKFLRTIRGVEAFVILSEVGSKKTRVNLRSSGRINVAKVAHDFGGGGHHNASGCLLDQSLSQAQKSILKNIRKKL